MNKIKAIAGFLILAAISTTARGQVVLLKDGDAKMIDCKATERLMFGDSKVIGICVRSNNRYTGVYFGDERDGYIQWLTMKALKASGLTITEEGQIVKVSEDGTMVPFKDETDEYRMLQEAFRQRVNRTFSVQDDELDQVS